MQRKGLDDLALRNRKNQQNFRERRRQYVRNLEARLQACESQRIEAMKQVQLAARRVDYENRILRRVLKERFRLTEEEIHRILQHGLPTQTSATQHPKSPDAAMVPGYSHNSLSKNDSLQSLAYHDSPCDTETRQHSNCGAADKAMNRDLNARDITAPSSNADSMSCEAASEILLNIQANVTAEEIRQELGCGQQYACQVRNRDVFQVLNARL